MYKRTMSVITEAKPWYPYVSRTILGLLAEGRMPNVVSVTTEPKYGYLMRLEYVDGLYRIVHENDLGVNNSSAARLATDKGYAKFILRSIGINCPGGTEFLVPWWAADISRTQLAGGRDMLQTTDKIAEYIQQNMGYPIYIKPADGSEGNGVFRVDSEDELVPILHRYEKDRVKVVLVEPPVKMPDYRIVVFDGQLICAYKRSPLSVIGDGDSTIRQLIAILQKHYDEAGRSIRLSSNDTHIRHHLAKYDMTTDDVPSKGQIVPLLAVSNLATGGTAEDVTERLHPHWATLASDVARNFSLRLIGLDLACEDIEDPGSDYSVIEVNAFPGMSNYACSGEVQKKLVDEFYAKILNESPVC